MIKITDIPRLIHVNGGVTWDLDSIQYTLDRFAKSYGLDLDPDFQRGHVWTQDNKICFMEYILRGGAVPPIRFNSPEFGGHPRAKHCDLSEAVVLVDGKQRLTAVLEFIDNKVPVFGGHFLKDFDKPDAVLRSTALYYQVNKLQTRKELLQWYLEMNEGAIAHTTEELDRVRKMLTG